MNTTVRNKKVKLTARDWEQAALALIADKGLNALAVEPLARLMGITKGSFYWHFPNREALLTQALNHWEEHDARNLTRALSAIADPTERLRSFFRASSREVFTAEVFSSLVLAADHPQVEPVLERVASRRIKHLSQAFEQLGLDSEAAENRARLSYSSYMGFLQLQRQRQAPSLSSEAFDAYVEHVIDTLIPEAPA